MRKIVPYIVTSSLPARLKPLAQLARNLWWTWHPDALSLWSRLDPALWVKTGHNPIKMLGQISQSRFNELAEDDGFTNHMDRVKAALDEYMDSTFWFQKAHQGRSSQMLVAYFSAEFGITECLPIYSGGLGILAGDHLKSSSDLGLPLVGVGLLYQEGYFHQYLNNDGWQQETYPENDFFNMPVFRELDENGQEIKISVQFPGKRVTARVWRAQVGRARLYLLDSNIPENDHGDRKITNQLYGGDHRMRIEQEKLLGMGGVKALRALGLKPNVFHMNEGHSAFLALERIRDLVREEGLSFHEAKEEIIASSVFTTHTPVPAGNDMFSPQLVLEYFRGYANELSLSERDFLALGRQDPDSNSEPFCMTVLAMRLSACANGVSKLHSLVSQKMWKDLYRGLDSQDVPIRAITNGVHIRSWLSDEMWNLFNRYLGSQWESDPANDSVWRRIGDIPDAELWRAHERRRDRLVGFARRRLKESLKRFGASAKAIEIAEEALRPDALTIGFARRFATYKRATLLFTDLARLKKILNDKKRPVQIIIAGKAHPKDEAGKNLIKNIVHWTRDPMLRDKIIFIENYDINVARYLVQGVDVWLNTPRRPMEASGTSGMKASANGALNFSVLDGWWCEGYAHDTGWAIGQGEDYGDLAAQDIVESKAIYDILESEIVPLFYDRGRDDMPRGWISMMKSSLSKLNLVFNTNRMARNYTTYFYMPAFTHVSELTENGSSRTRIKELADWKSKIARGWHAVKIEDVASNSSGDLSVGAQIETRARIRLGELSHDDLKVEIYYGATDKMGEIVEGRPAPMKFVEFDSDLAIFAGSIPLVESGAFGYTIRVTPSSALTFGRIEPGYVHWLGR